jgi:hypothetical protein
MITRRIGEPDTPKPNRLGARDKRYLDRLSLWHDCRDSKVVDALRTGHIDFDEVEDVAVRVVHQGDSVFVYEIELGGYVAGTAGEAGQCHD